MPESREVRLRLNPVELPTLDLTDAAGVIGEDYGT
jgi:hypothetical protein